LSSGFLVRIGPTDRLFPILQVDAEKVLRAGKFGYICNKTAAMNKVITEITPLSSQDCFYLIDRYKSKFDYPLHRHAEYELNFVENCKDARRIVGDSVEILGDYDLALIGGGLEHTWEAYRCTHSRIREITIQFSPDLIDDTFFGKNQMRTLKELFERAKSGVAFEMPAIMRLYGKLDYVTHAQPGFYRVIRILEILYELSVDEHYHELASASFSNKGAASDSRRVYKVEEFISQNYRQPIRLRELADMAGMTPTAFSRFFKLRTGRTVSDYIIDTRLGFAARKLVDSTMSIVEICYDCGFNNISNFNRSFKNKKGCSPKVFRENYRKNKVIV